LSDELKVISLEEAQRLLGNNVVVALDPKADWVFNPGTGASERLDGKFFKVIAYDRGNFHQLGIYEEPRIEAGSEPRVVGNVKISRNARGFIRSRINRGLDGDEFREATLSSLSNPEAVEFDEQAVRSALIQTNPQRIGGYVRVFLVEEEFDDSEGVTVDELRRTTDGRTLAALAALIL